MRFSECYHNQFIRDALKAYRQTVREEARKYAFALRIPEPIKVTTIAPTGTVSNLPGVTSGCQPIFSKYFKRRVIYASNDKRLEELEHKGFAIEDSAYTKDSRVVSFYCKDPLVHEVEKAGLDIGLIEEQHEISLSDHLAVQAMLQELYADNAISYTINFDPVQYSVEDIEKALIAHLPYLKGTTMMPENMSRPQMPLERITKEQFEEAATKGLAMVSDVEMECKNGACPVK